MAYRQQNINFTMLLHLVITVGHHNCKRSLADPMSAMTKLGASVVDDSPSLPSHTHIAASDFDT